MVKKFSPFFTEKTIFSELLILKAKISHQNIKIKKTVIIEKIKNKLKKFL
jgi:hypothetical protein